ncbi:DUF1176 domain-containing protein [Stenotrophomonas sp. GZD-301]|uniref:DUF1176 domain-containing protein n=1 Tax=Stenotrophomonas sp. GZD-301 TaxID=3404814 RepID=UPI003BB67E62
MNVVSVVPLLAVALAAALPAHAATPVYRQFQDWVVACDNVARCVASGAAEGVDGRITVQRAAGPQGAIEVSVVLPTRGGSAPLLLDGKPVALAAPGWTRAPDGAERVLRQTRSLAAAQGFIDAVRNGSALRFGTGERDAIPLGGLSAALLLVDETQGRLGGGTALLRRGDAAASKVPAAAPLPRVTLAPPPRRALDAATQARLIAQVRRSQSAVIQREDCSQHGGDDAFDEAAALDDTQALVLIECLRGAYQSSSLVFRVPVADASRATRVTPTLPFALPGVRTRLDMLTSAAFEDGVLTHSGRGRGIGDCGSGARWGWTGTTFALLAYEHMGACRGDDAAEWPALWRTANAP